MPLDAAHGLIYFRLTADADEFLTIAKFRALRKLWARVEQACGLTPKPTYVAAETAWRMMTFRHHAPCRLGGDIGWLWSQAASLLDARPQFPQRAEFGDGEKLVGIGGEAEIDQ